MVLRIEIGGCVVTGESSRGNCERIRVAGTPRCQLWTTTGFFLHRVPHLERLHHTLFLAIRTTLFAGSLPRRARVDGPGLRRRTEYYVVPLPANAGKFQSIRSTVSSVRFLRGMFPMRSRRVDSFRVDHDTGTGTGDAPPRPRSFPPVPSPRPSGGNGCGRVAVGRGVERRPLAPRADKKGWAIRARPRRTAGKTKRGALLPSPRFRRGSVERRFCFLFSVLCFLSPAFCFVFSAPCRLDCCRRNQCPGAAVRRAAGCVPRYPPCSRARRRRRTK